VRLILVVTDGKENISDAGPPPALDEEPLDAALRALGSQAATLTFTQVAAISEKSPSWWRQQARCGAVQTVQFGGGTNYVVQLKREPRRSPPSVWPAQQTSPRGSCEDVFSRWSGRPSKARSQAMADQP
jgi:hypothetical protein